MILWIKRESETHSLLTGAEALKLACVPKLHKRKEYGMWPHATTKLLTITDSTSVAYIVMITSFNTEQTVENKKT